MTTPEPHPLRCRNKCDHWIDDGTISGKCKIARYYDGTIEYKNMLFIEAVGCASHSSGTDAKVLDALKEIIDLVEGRYEGMKDFYETPSEQRTGTDREAKLMFVEVKIIKECIDIILEHSGLAELRQGKQP